MLPPSYFKIWLLNKFIYFCRYIVLTLWVNLCSRLTRFINRPFSLNAHLIKADFEGQKVDCLFVIMSWIVEHKYRRKSSSCQRLLLSEWDAVTSKSQLNRSRVPDQTQTSVIYRGQFISASLLSGQGNVLHFPVWRGLTWRQLPGGSQPRVSETWLHWQPCQLLY